MDSYDSWLKSFQKTVYYEHDYEKLKQLSMTPFDVYERRNEIDINVVTFHDQLNEIIDCVVRNQTHQTTRLCNIILSNHQSESKRCSLCPFRNCSFNIKGNPVLSVPKKMFSRVRHEFRRVITDIRGSFDCKCNAGVGQDCCDYDCVVQALSTAHDTRLRPYIPEMDIYFDERASVVYPVVPIIKFVRETDVDVYFTLHVYTKKQARSMHIRIRNMLAELPWPHRHSKVITTPRQGDNRVAFNRILNRDGKVNRFAGAIPKNAIVVVENKALFIIDNLYKYKERWNIPSLQVKMIPCNLHRLYCLTCTESVTANMSSRILSDLANKPCK